MVSRIADNEAAVPGADSVKVRKACTLYSKRRRWRARRVWVQLFELDDEPEVLQLATLQVT